MKNAAIIVLAILGNNLFGQSFNQGLLFLNYSSGHTIHETGVKLHTSLIEKESSDVQSLMLRLQLNDFLNLNDDAQADISLDDYRIPYGRLVFTSEMRNKYFSIKNNSCAFVVKPISPLLIKSDILKEGNVGLLDIQKSRDRIDRFIDSTLKNTLRESNIF